MEGGAPPCRRPLASSSPAPNRRRRQPIGARGRLASALRAEALQRLAQTGAPELSSTEQERSTTLSTSVAVETAPSPQQGHGRCSGDDSEPATWRPVQPMNQNREFGRFSRRMYPVQR